MEDATMPTLESDGVVCPWCEWHGMTGLWPENLPCHDDWHFLGWYHERKLPYMRAAARESGAAVRIGERTAPCATRSCDAACGDVWAAWDLQELIAFWQRYAALVRKADAAAGRHTVYSPLYGPSTHEAGDPPETPQNRLSAQLPGWLARSAQATEKRTYGPRRRKKWTALQPSRTRRA